MGEDTFLGDTKPCTYTQDKENKDASVALEKINLKMKEGLEYVGIRLGLEIKEGDYLYKSEEGDDNYRILMIHGVLNGRNLKMIKTDRPSYPYSPTYLCLDFWDKRDDECQVGHYRVDAEKSSRRETLSERYGELCTFERSAEEDYNDKKFRRLIEDFRILEEVAMPKPSQDETE